MRTSITVGVITRAHGVKGEVVVDLRTDEPSKRFAPGAVLRAEPDGRRGTAPGPGNFTVVGTREHQGRWLVTFAEIGDRTIAETMRGVRLSAEVPADERPDDAEEFYDRQLVGLSVIITGGPESIGTISAVLHLPAQDVLEIDTDSGTRLVPFVTELVPEVDLAAGRVVVADIAGLLDEVAESDADPTPGEAR